MPISVSQIQNVKRPISILIDGEELNCVYRLGLCCLTACAVALVVVSRTIPAYRVLHDDGIHADD